MTILGIYISKEKLEYCIVDGNKDSITLVKHELKNNKNYNSISELMEWYDNLFSLIFDDQSLTKIGLITASPGIHGSMEKNVPYWYYPCGILYLNAKNKNLIVEEFKKPRSSNKKLSSIEAVARLLRIDVR